MKRLFYVFFLLFLPILTEGDDGLQLVQIVSVSFKIHNVKILFFSYLDMGNDPHRELTEMIRIQIIHGQMVGTN